MRRNIFLESISNPKIGDIAVIAEIKLKSPSTGRLGKRDDIVDRAKQYQQASADAISVVTDKKYFGGDVKMVSIVKQTVDIPVLQKDFIIDASQIYEAKKNQADAILLIAKLYKNDQLNKYLDLCNVLSIAPVVEVYDEKYLGKIGNAKIIGVNARNLQDFTVNIDKACTLIKRLSKQFIVIGFSGIKSRREVELYKNAGAKAVLVGTSLMKSKNINKFIRNLKGI